MAQPSSSTSTKDVTIEYFAPNLKPPVFIFTNLSEPPWEAVEMSFDEEDKGYRFYKKFNGPDGDYQYKFRLGHGNWWVCDDSKPQIDDGFGNKNNRLHVGGSTTSSKVPMKMPSMPALTAQTKPSQSTSSAKLSEPSDLPSTMPKEGDERWPVGELYPLLPHEMPPKVYGIYESALERRRMSGMDPALRAAIEADMEKDDDPAPLFPHESGIRDPSAKVRPITDEENPFAYSDSIDHSDPSLIPFPSGRENILKELLSVQNHPPSWEPAQPPHSQSTARGSNVNSSNTKSLADLQEGDEDSEADASKSDGKEKKKDVARSVGDASMHPAAW